MALTVWFALWGEKDHNSPAGKRTRDLLIKLQVLYQLSYQGIHAPLRGDERSMYSLVAQLVEHLKLNQEVPGSLPGWGIMIFFSSQGKPDCQSHLLSLRQSFTYIAKQSRWTFIHGRISDVTNLLWDNLFFSKWGCLPGTLAQVLQKIAIWPTTQMILHVWCTVVWFTRQGIMTLYLCMLKIPFNSE